MRVKVENKLAETGRCCHIEMPVASLSGGGRLFGLGFPPAWYQPISVGAFTKGLGFEQFWPKLIASGQILQNRSRIWLYRAR